MPNQTPVPDDTSVSSLPRGQVDYLSHNWKEEDVWRSWRNMTRQKNEIANGPRLENASWRTWWKQRNKLKTVSPETLNWLKDSDVTWLYGPLHTAVEWTPPPKAESPPTTVEKDLSTQDRLDLAYPKKPILKHRSIGELLLSDFHHSPLYHPVENAPFDLFHEEEPQEEEPIWLQNEDLGDTDMRPVTVRPPLVHTKSDSQVQLAEQALRVRRESPPRIIPHRKLSDEAINTPVTTKQMSGESESIPKRKHISFNTFVEQCIAIDSPNKLFPSGSTTPRSIVHLHDDGYDEDSEDGILEEDEDDDDESFTPRSYFSATVSDEDEDEDEVLEIRTAHTQKRPRSTRSSSSSSSSGSSRSRSNPRIPSTRSTFPVRSASTGALHFDHILVRTPSFEKEHITIAPIAPTMLKANGTDPDGDDYPHHGGVDRWGVINKNADLDLVYLPPTNSNYSTPTIEAEDYLSHGSPYFRSEASMAVSQGSAVVITPPSPAAPRINAAGFLNQGIVGSPSSGLDTAVEDDPYDYFGGPDLGESFPNRRRSREPRVSIGRSAVRHSQDRGANADVERSRSRSLTKGDTTPRSRLSRSRSRSRTPSPAEGWLPSSSTPAIAVNLPRVRSGGLLSPSDTSYVPRGRQSSTSSDGQSRGRSSTRSSSFSDHDRSTSCSTSSPLGSLSPDASSANLNRALYGGVYVSGRVAETRGRRLDSSSRSHSSGSTSTEESSTGPSSQGRTSPVESALVSASCSSDESTSSTIGPSADKRDLSTSTIIPQPDMDNAAESETRRSQHPTPSNSPTPTPLMTKRSSLTINRPPLPSPVSSSDTATGIVSPLSSPIHQQPPQPAGTLVGRTMNMANAILVSMWN